MTAQPTAPMTGQSFGKSVKRVEDTRLIQGKGKYVDNIIWPGQCYGAFVRSPYAHASITDVDTSGAQEVDGVVGVLTIDDILKANIPPLPCGFMITDHAGEPMKQAERFALAKDTVRYVGEPIALVVATSKQAAQDAAEAVMVEFDDLPATADARVALSGEAEQLHKDIPNNLAFDWRLGDADAADKAFEGAAHVAKLTLRNNRLVPNPMEPRAINASWNAVDEQLTIHMTHQNPMGMRVLFSAYFGLAPEHKLRMVSPDVGGGFGVKAHNYPEEVTVALAAKLLGRPVKWTCERSESFVADAHGRDHFTDIELALDADGTFLGLRADTVANIGAYMSTSGSLIPTWMYGAMLSGQYVIPAMNVRSQAVYTNTCPVDAYRGAGRPEAAYAIERIVDVAARQMGIDPADLRQRNFIRDFPYQSPLVYEYDSGDYDKVLKAGLDIGEYDGFAARKAESAQRGKRRGIGISAYVEACGIGPSAKLAKMGAGGGLWESAEVRVHPSGAVEVLTGAHSHGQGHATTFAQVVSDRFGVPLEQVSVVEGDSDRIQAGTGTYGSRASVGMSATVRACDTIIEKGKDIAAHMLGVERSSVDFDGGLFSTTQSNQTLAFGEVAYAAHAANAFPTDEIEPGLVATSFFDPPNFTFPAGIYLCEVEIDEETGVVEVVSFSAADDFGNVANPMIVEGQVHGGLTQGIGQALLENSLYSDDDAQLLTGSFIDYTMPRADNVPNYDLTFAGTPSPSNPLGMKGCGEAGAIGSPPAVINAICNALDIEHIDMPATPEKIWRILQER